MSKTVLIKKYSNRRLYDTEKSSYVTLNQVGEVIKAGRTVKVVDAKTGEDVTTFILNQIILEASRNQAMLPASLLHLIIRYGDNLLSEFFDQYLEESLQMYLDSKIAFDNQFRQWLKMGMSFPEVTKTMSERKFFPNLFDFFQVYPDESGGKNQSGNNEDM